MKRIMLLVLSIVAFRLVLLAGPLSEPITSAEDIVTGWYRVKCVADNAGGVYVGRFVYNGESEYVQTEERCYPLFMQVAAVEPQAADATFYVRMERDGNNIYVRSANGHYINKYTVASLTPVAIPFNYDSKGFQIGEYWAFFPSLGNILGKSESASDYRFALYRVDPAAAGLTEWQVRMSGRNEVSAQLSVHARISCSGEGLSGLSSVYDNGYFFFEDDFVPRLEDFETDDGEAEIIVDEDNHLIKVEFDPHDIDIATVKQGYHTTGRGNAEALLLAIDLRRNKAGAALKGLTARLKGNTARNVKSIAVYQTTTSEFLAAARRDLLGEAVPGDDGEISMDLTGSTLWGGANYLWLTAAVADDAAFGEELDAVLTGITYTMDGVEGRIEVPAALGDPAGAARIFEVQSFAYVPNTGGSRYYRIPAMTLDKNGNIVVAADRRYNSNGDLGNHKIDVSVRRSLDGGRTWTAQNIIATGDGSTATNFGYGDPALVRTAKGRLICVMAAGSASFWDGMKYAIITTSDDNGVTWKKPRHLYSSRFVDAVNGTTNRLGFFSNFISSGKGLCTSDGTVMFTTNCLVDADDPTPQCYIISSSDEGNSWTLGPAKAYAGCDESKLVELNDGSLMVSVRQSGARGFNGGNADGSLWGSQWRNSQISGNACNADILYYSRKTNGERDILLHSYINSSARENLTIAMSIDEGVSWHDFMNIQPGDAAYSTMERLPDGSLAVLYEDASFSAGNGYAINFLTIPAECINTFADRLKTSQGEDYGRAMETLENGGVYYFSTNFLADVETSEEYYLTADGRLTTDQSEAKYFTLQHAPLAGGFKPVGWKSGQFTNPENATTNTKYIRTNSQNRNDWEAQVITQDSEGLFAVRATNAATESTWGANSYWTTDAGGQATYDLNGTPHYVWKLTKVGSTPRFDPSKAYRLKSYKQGGYVIRNGDAFCGYYSGNDTYAADLLIESVPGEQGSFTICDSETGRYVSAVSSAGYWQMGESAAQLRIQLLEHEGQDVYALQAPFAGGFACLTLECLASPNLENGAFGIVNFGKNTEETYWQILTRDEALGIKEHQPAAAASPAGIYSIGGIRLGGLKKGLNIVRQSDGTVQKVYKME